jgi:hypothetical protein
MKARKRREFGEHSVSDPEICPGHLTFKGARMLAKDYGTKPPSHGIGARCRYKRSEAIFA